jgi:thiol-disulfide isomerase/thioredoxin
VADDLAGLSGGHGADEAGAGEALAGVALPRLGEAPDFVAPGEWFNTDGEPLSIAELTGEENRVVLVDFWTYTCINCIRTLPYLRAWDAEYRDEGLTIVGVHSPEFPFERDPANVADAIGRYDLAYPVVQDNEFGTWNAFGNQYWPAKYLIGADGEVRYVHFGEGAYEETEAAIRSLLAEARGDESLGQGVGPQRAETADPGLHTPETYLGWERAQGFREAPSEGERAYEAPPLDDLDLNDFALDGRWLVLPQSATAVEDASVSLRFQARRVFLVLGPGDGGPGRVSVELDGEPIAEADAGDDVDAGAVTVDEQRLYRLVDLDGAGEHTLTLRFDPGVSGYAFTFG